MRAADLPNPSDLPEEWVDLMGYWILRWIAEEGGDALAFKEPALRLARPALRLVQDSATAPVGISRVGGLPDLPPGFPWPTGHDYPATLSGDITGERRLAGFLAQIQLAEIADTLAGRDLPSTGLLSFFCFQDLENDKPDNMGAVVHYFADSSGLVRTEPPAPLTEGNEHMAEKRLGLVQTLDLPSGTSPWGNELSPEQNFPFDLFELTTTEISITFSATPARCPAVIRLNHATGGTSSQSETWAIAACTFSYIVTTSPAAALNGSRSCGLISGEPTRAARLLAEVRAALGVVFVRNFKVQGTCGTDSVRGSTVPGASGTPTTGAAATTTGGTVWM
jgi:hypothetical protein